MTTRLRPLAVLGAGTMGHGIAHAAIAAGYPVRLYDVSGTAADQGVGRHRRHRRQGRRARQADPGRRRGGRRPPDDHDRGGRGGARRRHGDRGGAREDGPQAGAVRRSRRPRRPPTRCSPRTPRRSASPRWPAVLERPARLVGMHFFNPVHKMKLVEIVRALETSDETLAAMQEVAAAMGKETVLVSESPGFVTSRINAMIGNEAFYMLQEGVAIGARHRQGAQARPQPPDGAVRAGRPGGPRHPPLHPPVPAPDARREVPPLPAARAVRRRPAGSGRKAGRGVYDY